MSSILAGSFSRNGPLVSSLEILYSMITASELVPASAVHTSAVSGWFGFKPFASAKALSAFCAFSPSLPSISPGENRARSSRTWILITRGSIFPSLGGFEVSNAALLIDAASIAVAGNTSQTHKTGAVNRRRIIGGSPETEFGQQRGWP